MGVGSNRERGEEERRRVNSWEARRVKAKVLRRREGG